MYINFAQVQIWIVLKRDEKPWAVAILNDAFNIEALKQKRLQNETKRK